jgi:hypothetical protein
MPRRPAIATRPVADHVRSPVGPPRTARTLPSTPSRSTCPGPTSAGANRAMVRPPGSQPEGNTNGPATVRLLALDPSLATRSILEAGAVA